VAAPRRPSAAMTNVDPARRGVSTNRQVARSLFVPGSVTVVL
jgi:hypothetical protein